MCNPLLACVIAPEPGVRERLLRGRAQCGVHGEQGAQKRERAGVRLRHAPPQAGALGAQDLIAPLATSPHSPLRKDKKLIARCQCVR